MITAVDTNVLVDVFKADEKFGPGSADLLRHVVRSGFYRDYFEKLRILDPTR